jgi:hypothetical protein
MSDESEGAGKPWQLTVSMDVVRAALEAALAEFEANHGTAVSVPMDYFWSIPAESLYSVESDPVGLTIGQLSETYEHLEHIAAGTSEPIDYSLVWLADILRAIADPPPQDSEPS